MCRRPLVLCLLLLCAFVALPAVAASAHHRSWHGQGWEDWRPGAQEEDDDDVPEDEPVEEEELGLPALDDGAAWFDAVEDSGGVSDVRPPVPGGATTAKPRAPRPAGSSTGSGALRGVPYRSQIIRYAKARNLEPAFVAAIVRAESGFNPRARSRAGARGLMQLMPATAAGMGVGVKRLYEPTTSIAYGTLYLAKVRQVVGPSLRLVAAGYNAGPNAVRRFRGIPPYAETRAYVTRVMAYRAAYRRR